MFRSIPGAFPSRPSTPTLPQQVQDLPAADERTALLGGQDRSPESAAGAPGTHPVRKTAVADAGGTISGPPQHPASEENSESGESSRTPESTFTYLRAKFGSTDLSTAKTLPMAQKAGWALASALKSTVSDVAKRAVNTGATRFILPHLLKWAFPMNDGAANAASKVINSGLQQMVPNSSQNGEVLVGKATVKAMAKIVAAEKFDRLVQPYVNILTDAKLTLKENAQNFSDGVAEEIQAFEEAHPEFKEQLAQLRYAVKTYSPPEGQTELDRDILGVLMAPLIMSQIPRLSTDPNDPHTIAPKGIFKSASKLHQFDDARPHILARASQVEIENPDDMEIFHTRWRNLQLADEMPFILIGGAGATEGDGAVDLAREWCKRVGETPMEVEADELAEMFMGSRPKDALPRLGPEDPSPVKCLGGFYSRVESGNPTSPMIITGFDPKNPDHAILIPLLESSSEISIPYRNIPGVFRFDTKGMAVFLCEDEAVAGRSRMLEGPAGDKAKNGAGEEKVKDKTKDKGKAKEKEKAPADEKAKDKTKDKGKEKGPDGERMKNLGLERLKVMPRATFTSPSEKRRADKLETALDTKVRERLQLIIPGDDSPSAALRDAVQETAASAAYKNLIVKSSMEHKLPLKEAETLMLYVGEHIASKYSQGVAQARSGQTPREGEPGSSSTGAEDQVNAFLASDAKQSIDESIEKFIGNYLKRFDKEPATKTEEKGDEKKLATKAEDKSDEKKASDPTENTGGGKLAPASLPPAWLENVDVKAMQEAFPIPISAQGKQPLARGQTTLDRFLMPERLSPLLDAAKRGDVDGLAQLLGATEGKLQETDRNKNGLLHLAVLSGNADAARTLLPRIDVNAQNKQGSTAAHIAIDKGKKELVHLLMEQAEAVDFSLRDKQGRTLCEAAKSLVVKRGGDADSQEIVKAVVKADPNERGAVIIVLPGAGNARSEN